ncbi:MAG: DUF4124 domain-containing protein [Sedimenticolaceae bacterium]
MRASAYLICLALLMPGLPVRADIYRCSGASGEPSFSQRPCGSDTTLVIQEAAGRRGDAVGLRPGERAWLQERARGSREGAQTDRRRRVSASDAKRKSEERAHRCQKKRRALDSVASRLRRGYKPAQGEGLRRRRAGYEDYLAAFCH